ncbi:hypothetical protein [Sporomusa sphaeroides]|uniref:Uncharacterized protein n=1 Tax=Sporomusa sphaeroides DSM 2875 TaxID=1337886 RepID=A0A1U7M9W7_9FIRM|nr:hypothetical protein [Sporomusa sphaeroides]OLS54351.1 hypothetical protein SPSPH_45970 [Sporomusa sphaeroides DSM 2875]CVK21647.1 hypothetical protein SSPH_04342 [Sporomusa sphaeroides DSM 2875]
MDKTDISSNRQPDHSGKNMINVALANAAAGIKHDKISTMVLMSVFDLFRRPAGLVAFSQAFCSPFLLDKGNQLGMERYILYQMDTCCPKGVLAAFF